MKDTIETKSNSRSTGMDSAFDDQSGCAMAPPPFQMMANEPIQRSVENALIGGAAGAIAGGVIGSALPVLGTGTGALVGGFLGGVAGALTGNDVEDPERGNTEVVDQITALLGATELDGAQVDGLMRSLATFTPDRLRVVVHQLSEAGRLTDFSNRILPAADPAHQGTIAQINALIAEHADPLQGTANASAEGEAAVNGILNEGLTLTNTGQVAAFVDVVNGRSYTQDIQETLDREVARILPWSQGRNALPRHDWDQYEEIGREAKKATDDLYGAYNVAGTPMVSGGPAPNLFDVRDGQYSDADLAYFANYLVTGHNAGDPIYPGQRIHDVHNASLSRNQESGILRAAITAWLQLGNNRQNILEVRRSWPGVQGGGNIYIQRWDLGSDDQNRTQFWRMFQTTIHEYLHKITHNNFEQGARQLGRHRSQIFIEGGTSYFDKKVWETLFPQEIASNAGLRERIEGQQYPYNEGLIPDHSGYAQMDQFGRIVEEVGEENAKAAYFRGEIQKIGMPIQ